MISVLVAQAALTLSATLLSWWLGGMPAAMAAAAGGAIAAVNVVLLAGRLGRHSGRLAPMGIAAERLAFHLAAFALAIGTLRLPPMPVIAGFAVAQFGYIAGFRTVLLDCIRSPHHGR